MQVSIKPALTSRVTVKPPLNHRQNGEVEAGKTGRSLEHQREDQEAGKYFILHNAMFLKLCQWEDLTWDIRAGPRLLPPRGCGCAAETP